MGQVQERLKQWEDNNVRTMGFDERMEAIRIKLESGLIEQAKMICMVENIRKLYRIFPSCFNSRILLCTRERFASISTFHCFLKFKKKEIGQKEKMMQV